jgi:hypothetical protein
MSQKSSNQQSLHVDSPGASPTKPREASDVPVKQEHCLSRGSPGKDAQPHQFNDIKITWSTISHLDDGQTATPV